MYCPVRICQPVSPSASSDFHPLAPQMNSQAISATKKQSANDGVSARIQRRVPGCATRVPGVAAGAGHSVDGVEVAKRSAMRDAAVSAPLSLDRPLAPLALARNLFFGPGLGTD